MKFLQIVGPVTQILSQVLEHVHLFSKESIYPAKCVLMYLYYVLFFIGARTCICADPSFVRDFVLAVVFRGQFLEVMQINQTVTSQV